MKKTIIMLMAMSALSISCSQKEPVLTPEQESLQTKLVGNVYGEREKGTLLVKVTADAQKAISEGIMEPDILASGLEEVSVEPIFPVSTRNDQTAMRHGLDRWYTVRFECSAEKAAGKLALCEHIQAIEYNTLIESTHDSDVSIEYVPAAMTKSTATSSLPFNDPKLDVQWNLINTGDKSISESAVEGADVGVKDAWKLTAGDPRIIVAVLDQGVSLLHPDLEANLWVNTAEYNGQSGVDDDGNGYKDDMHGYNFAENKGRPTAKTGADHGTHIAGTIAATNNNGVGVSSIAGGTGIGDGVRIMSCQIFDTDGSKTSKAMVAKAFHYAADHGASIVQCSYGESGETFTSDEEYKAKYSVEYDALAYFLDPANSNCESLETNIAVFASGNYNRPASLYPGALEGCISVTAFGPDFLPGGYSNYGAGCDISAPGGDIVENDANAPCMILSTGMTGEFGQAGYVYKYGTSMACPHVSGVIALGMSYALKIGKKFSREDFISRLLTSANDIDALLTGPVNKLLVENNKYVEVDVFPKKGKMGAGAVDAWKFLMALEGTPSYVTSPGEKLRIDIAECLGDASGHTLEVGAEAKSALGIEGTPAVKDGILEITCGKIGSGKIRFNASVGGEGQISGLDYYKEISIVSRPAVAKNGGWL